MLKGIKVRRVNFIHLLNFPFHKRRLPRQYAKVFKYIAKVQHPVPYRTAMTFLRHSKAIQYISTERLLYVPEYTNLHPSSLFFSPLEDFTKDKGAAQTEGALHGANALQTCSIHRKIQI